MPIPLSATQSPGYIQISTVLGTSSGQSPHLACRTPGVSLSTTKQTTPHLCVRMIVLWLFRALCHCQERIKCYSESSFLGTGLTTWKCWSAVGRLQGLAQYLVNKGGWTGKSFGVGRIWKLDSKWLQGFIFSSLSYAANVHRLSSPFPFLDSPQGLVQESNSGPCTGQAGACATELYSQPRSIIHKIYFWRKKRIQGVISLHNTRHIYKTLNTSVCFLLKCEIVEWNKARYSWSSFIRT